LSLVEVELCMFLTWVAILHSIDANGDLIFDLCHNKFNSGFFCSNWVGFSFRYVAEGTNFVLILQLQTENLSNYFYIIMLTIGFTKFRPPNPATSVAVTSFLQTLDTSLFNGLSMLVQ
jgi:hypothetical protein